jgi:hypothetical protein
MSLSKNIEETKRKNIDRALVKWRKHYNSVKAIGGYLKYCRDNNVTLSPKQEQNLLDEADKLCAKCSAILDKAGLKLPKPKWPHDKDVPCSWLSHPTFIFGNLA